MPSLPEIVRRVESNAVTIHVVGPPDGRFADELSRRFVDRNVEIGSTNRNDGGPTIGVVSRNGTPLLVLDSEELRTLVGRGGESNENRSPMKRIVPHLDERTFVGSDRSDLLSASREIEDLAFRRGAGELHAGFQRSDAIDAQQSVYERLAETELSIYLYVPPDDQSTPTVEGATLHTEDTPELARTWFVAFEGADGDVCTLVAEEREPNQYTGVWSYDPNITTLVLDRLRSRYRNRHRI